MSAFSSRASCSRGSAVRASRALFTIVSHMMEAVSARVAGVDCCSIVLLGGKRAVVVKPVAELVRNRGDLLQRAVEVAEDSRLLDRGDRFAEGPARLPVPRLGVDPSPGERAFGERPQPR